MKRVKAVLGRLTKPIFTLAKDDEQKHTNRRDNDYGLTNASRTFIEINKQYKQDVINNLEEADSLGLLYLSYEVQRPYRYTGLGWQDLFSERPTDWKKLRWTPMHLVNEMSEKYKLNDDCMFRVWFCAPGILHVEVDDDGEWTVHDILTFPEWMMIG